MQKPEPADGQAIQKSGEPEPPRKRNVDSHGSDHRGFMQACRKDTNPTRIVFQVTRNFVVAHLSSRAQDSQKEGSDGWQQFLMENKKVGEIPKYLCHVMAGYRRFYNAEKRRIRD